MNRFSARIKRLSRKLGAKPTQDPDGVIATLEIARRLINEDPDITPWDALRQAADRYASPKDPVKAFWAAWRVYVNAVANVVDGSDPSEALKLAADRQGQMNQLVKKGPR